VITLLLLLIIVGVGYVFSDDSGSFLFGEADNSKSVEALKSYNDSIENTERYRKILPEVMAEVYRTYATNEIRDAEEHLNRMGDSTDLEYSYYEREKISEAKALLNTQPEKAAELYFRMGTCQDLWSIQKAILKEKYGIVWYTPAELNPNTRYD